MASVAKFGLTWLNPLWWAMYIPYLFLIKLPVWVFCLPWNTCKATWKAWKWTQRNFSSTWSRAAVGGLAIFTAIPGTWTYVFYEAAHWLGYGEQADAVVTIAKTVFSAAWEAGKFAFYLASAG